MTTHSEHDVLDTLAAVSLDELVALAELQTRRDRKYAVPRSALATLVAATPLGTRVLAIDDRRTFHYESVYFDTVDLTCYFGAARRRPQRFKVRTRTYLDSAESMLEVKTRDARGRTVKQRHPYHHEHRAVLTDEARAFVAGIDQAHEVATNLRETLTTNYRRATLLLPDGARVTIDVNLSWRHRDGRAIACPALALVETKSSGQPSAVDRLLWRAGHRPTVFSKYCTGLAAITSDLPSNKWHRTLQRHFNGAETDEH